ncbi:XAP5, circadian clock regulator-domain-containing protein [Chytridium lagenaria]|nr:XAP5, circadian clock regulator-domain-containing protein [Chytridium lagenaria]
MTPSDTEVKIGSEKFVSQHDLAQSELIKHTVGLVKLEDFQRIRESGQEKARGIEAKLSRRKKETKSKLSFADDEDGTNEKDEDDEEAKRQKTKKNPFVDTSFLPDRDREEAERREREVLKLEWLKHQEKIKQEKITITYSYWDGTGHRKQVDCKKGDTIGNFLELCRQQWHELRSVNVDNLIYVKEDLIIPHHYTFYDFIINQTRGKSGPLFAFDVFDDVRLTNDASVETEESHAGKIIQRSWYEKNKHIFPASRWEVFDPTKVFEKYTVKDLTKNKQE